MSTEKKKTNNVKFDKDKQKKMKFLSKFIYILAKIGRIITIIEAIIPIILIVKDRLENILFMRE